MILKKAVFVSLNIVLISFLSRTASECQDGRMIGPVPSVTDER